MAAFLCIHGLDVNACVDCLCCQARSYKTQLDPRDAEIARLKAEVERLANERDAYRSSLDVSFEVIKRNIQSKLDVLGNSGIPIEAGLRLVLRDLEVFQKMNPHKLKEFLKS